MEATTIGGVVRKCGERLFRHVETSQGTKEVTNQFVTYCKVKGITVPKDPNGDYAFKQFVRKEFEAASKSLGAPSLRTADGNPVGSLAFLVACAAGFDKDSVMDHQLKEGFGGKPVIPLLLVDHMAFTNFKLYFRFTDLYRQVTNEKEPFKELMASNHTALMLQFREVLIKDCKAFGWENIANVRVCGMQASHAPDAASSLHGTGYQPSKDIPTSSAPVRTLAQTNPATSGFYVENFTGLKVSRPVVGSLVVRERLSDGEFLKLSHLAAHTRAPPPSWTTLGVIASKVQAEGKTGSMYSRWQLSDLAGTSITLFLFGQAHKELYKESEGSVVIVRAAKLKREERGPGQVSMSVEQPEQVQRIGHSPDFGFCLGKKQDGGRCSAVVNRSQCEFCVHHAKTALRQLQAKRPELSGAGRSLFERQLVPIVNKAEA
ncbi:hypothetical protein V8C86DRAFT_3144665, partial [Haematococcus lacustris]